MKKYLLIATLLLPSLLFAQQRCYRFAMHGSFPDWQDTSFVACTSNLTLISELQAELSLPVAQRNKHISGNITGGNTGVNSNGAHNFLWHFIPGQWSLAEISAEVCDGRPYSDVDADTAYWIQTVQYFCPWSSYVAADITGTTGIGEPATGNTGWHVFPNPATTQLTVSTPAPATGNLQLIDARGRVVLQQNFERQPRTSLRMDLHDIAPGLYLVRITGDRQVFTERLVKE